MQNTKAPARGYNAAQPAHVQVQNTIENMRNMRDGKDLRKYSKSARKELLLGGTIDIMTKDGKTVIGAVPKLALVVASSTFRTYLEKSPNSSSVKISNTSIDVSAVSVLLIWLNAITKSVGKYGVTIPDSNDDLIKIRYAAQMLGMDPYVTHLVKAYKDDLRLRTPPPSECTLLEQCTVYKNDEMINAMGARLAYLRRTGSFGKEDLIVLTELFKDNKNIGDAAQRADARALSKHDGGASKA
ncbi:uncharacterized protein K460DRAFT_407324 [Cucurbitaria berberidis CBS 394.84]|uniref:BTB domain-containing protein n=1 Tax=Cucurbitaria berberidis CBS 394.84 TaxID=1168544 RepID=A0A9P4GCM0_9PLEO|nr:uncharacterized protein K460DRAFT_407324 [Cucurbitaria berberidis CBS 394.84]KAF1842952.1 hypothetical protein K460DRAFT_407324 [Cucurbitaria berberidis CBS 394.84]